MRLPLACVVVAAVAFSTIAPSGTSVAQEPGQATRDLPAESRQVVRHGNNEVGGDWAGYVAVDGVFTSVQASWIEPDATCTSDANLASPWVGIDGDGSETVEQIGTDIGCRNGQPFHAAWYEMYPADSVYFANPVAAGDAMTASVTRSGNTYTMKLVNSTKNWSRTVVKKQKSMNVSAEVILEAPGSSFPDFGTVKFTNAKINGKKLSSFDPVGLDAGHGDGVVQTRTGAITQGANFTVSFLHE